MAIDKEKGFRRLTKAVSTAGGAIIPIPFIVVIIATGDLGKNKFHIIILSLLIGLAVFFGAWGIFYLVRWIVRGFDGKKE